jgi:peptidoglycan/xylan/chitin deacetylase (PgdA/CDA1 family)
VAAVIAMVMMAAVLTVLGLTGIGRNHAGTGARTESGNRSRADRPAVGQPAPPPASSSGPASSSPTPAAPVAAGPPLPPDPTGPDGALTDTGNGNVALTFDDGPNPDYTLQVLALLRQYKIHATFCLIGEQVQEYPDLVRAIVADGHTLCNHSWDHDEQMADKSADYIRSEIQRTTDAIEAASPGAVVRYYRQPGGNWSPTIVQIAREMGMSSLDWSVDPQDWTVPPAATIESAVSSQTQTGSIVLMHDGGGDRSHTITALGVLLPSLEQRFHLQPMPTVAPSADSPANPGANQAANQTTNQGGNSAADPAGLSPSKPTS